MPVCDAITFFYLFFIFLLFTIIKIPVCDAISSITSCLILSYSYLILSYSYFIANPKYTPQLEALKAQYLLENKVRSFELFNGTAVFTRLLIILLFVSYY